MKHLHLIIAGTLTLAPTGLALASATPAPSAPPTLHKWRLPLATTDLLRPFTPPTRRYGRGHRGVDLTAMLGSPLCAPADGTLTFVGQVNHVATVVIAHDAGYRSTYQSVTTNLKVGTKVSAGEVFATVSASGHLAGVTCLHWGVLQGSTYLDPLSLLPRLKTHLLP